MKTRQFPRLAALCIVLWVAPAFEILAGEFDPATDAINQLGLELYGQFAAKNDAGNVVLSPYSIQTALAMTYAGADGETRAEMAKVLHFPAEDAPLAQSFSALRKSFDAAVKASPAEKNSKPAAPPGFLEKLKSLFAGGGDDSAAGHTLQIRAANRLFGAQGFQFRKPFLGFLKNDYGAPLEPLDFKGAPEKSRTRINGWVEEETAKKILDLIPDGGIDSDTRLVLVNALYFKAPWNSEFSKAGTGPRPFHVEGGAPVDVPTMVQRGGFGYAKRDGFTAVSLAYQGGAFSFLVLLPDEKDGLEALATKLTPSLLKECAALPAAEIVLFLPKFRNAGQTVPLDTPLQALGMKTAFDVPEGSANFDRMAPRTPKEYLAISNVFHRTFIELEEGGTEAAAATAVEMLVVTTRAVGVAPPPPPPEVHVDHPFLFAIQHRPSGACLFLGRIVDPR